MAEWRGREAIRTWVAIAAVLISIGCSSGGTVDNARHENLYRAAKSLESAVGVGVTLARYRELLQQFATELSISKDKAANRAEREMITAFADAFIAYRDAGTLWDQKVRGVEQLSPAGNAELMGIADAYPIRGSGSGANFTFAVDAAMQTVWRAADARLTRAVALYNGQSAPDLPDPPGR